MYYLRSRLNRNLGGMQFNGLYSHCRVGTKRIIEQYNAEVQRALEFVSADPTIPHSQKLAFFKVNHSSFLPFQCFCVFLLLVFLVLYQLPAAVLRRLDTRMVVRHCY